jgi:hypothetical protein
MNDLIKTEFFVLMNEDSQNITNEQMHLAYETFVKDVETLNQPETDLKTIFRILNITRIEFRTLQLQILCEQGGKMRLKICIVKK